MDDVDWNERAAWTRAAEHAADGLVEPNLSDAGEDREGSLSDLVRDYFQAPEEHRLAITITRANGLPLDDFELKELARRSDYPHAGDAAPDSTD